MDNTKMKCSLIPTVIINNPIGNYTDISFRLKNKNSNPTSYYIPEEGDNVYLTLSKSYNAKNYVIQKDLKSNSLNFDETTNRFNFSFSYEDTIKLDYSTYVGDITILKPDKKPFLVCYVEFNNCYASTSRTIEVV